MPLGEINVRMQKFWFNPKEYTSFSIPWDQFDEMEVQAVIKLLYESQGFEVHWIHAEDRSHESGADLVCNKGTKTVAIAVKKKPGKGDLYQLIELNKFSADERVYVYSGRATVNFDTERRKYANVVFWTYQNLQEHLFTQAFEIGFDLVVDNAPFTIELLSLFYRICDFVIEKETQQKTPDHCGSVTSDTLSLLWDGKDRTSALHKCTKLFHAIFESKELPSDISYSQLLSLVSLGFNFLLFDSLQQLGRIMKLILTEHRSLLSESYVINRGASYWRIFQDLPPYDFVHIFQPGKVLEKCACLQKEAKKLSTIKGSRWDVENLTNQELVATRIKLLSNFFLDVEAIVDAVFHLAITNV